MIEAFNDRQAREADLLMWQGWHIAMFTRAKRMPSLKKILSNNSEKKPQSAPEELFKIAKSINAALGGVDNTKSI